MGSTAKGLITGFICRLCSKMNRYVILIYGEEGERMGLADKINSYLPITVTKNDPLPKTVCPNCVDRLEKHSRMVQMITKAESKFNDHLAVKGRKRRAERAARAEGGSEAGEEEEEEEEEEDGDGDGDGEEEEECGCSEGEEGGSEAEQTLNQT